MSGRIEAYGTNSPTKSEAPIDQKKRIRVPIKVVRKLYPGIRIWKLSMKAQL